MSFRRLLAAAALGLVATCAGAFSNDPQIVIDRALDSPTLTVRYHGVSVALIELKVNGASLGTRSVTSAQSAGETNFTLNLSDLRDGDNDVEVRLFDREGHLVGHEHTNIQTEAVQSGPVLITEPKMGATLRGPAEISVNVDSSLKNVYVSFFIDGNFKSMTNFPPYTYVWDTERETNGWHELEAWAIDDTSETHKTRKMRVFVNNVQGRTDRQDVVQDLTPSGNTQDGMTVASKAHDLKPIQIKVNSQAVSTKRFSTTTPTIHPQLSAEVGSVVPALSDEANAKPVTLGSSVMTGAHHLLPTGSRVAVTVPERNTLIAMTQTEIPAKPVAGSASVASTGVRTMTPVVTKLPLNLQTEHSGEVVSVQPDLPAKSFKTATPVVSGVKAMTPKLATPAVPATKVAMIQKPHITAALNNVASATSLISIARGTRLSGVGTFAISLNNNFVDFHGVDPRVDEGVPMTPIRYLLEDDGGKVEWVHATKQVHANAQGNKIDLQIGHPNATVNSNTVSMEKAPYIDRGRTIVPLSFVKTALKVQVQYDKKTGHVLITSAKK
jgi:hypothetical protein